MSVERQNGTVYFSHSGGNPGFACRLVASAEGGRGAAVMTNSECGGVLYMEVLRSIAVEYQWADFLPPEFDSIESAIAVLQLNAEFYPRSANV